MNAEQNKVLGLERLILLQAVAESYLLKTTGKHFYEEYPGVQEEYGVLLEQHVDLLKAHLADEFASMNLNLNECIEKSGEKPAPAGKLTQYEVNALIRTADIVLFTYCTVEERKQRFLKEN